MLDWASTTSVLNFLQGPSSGDDTGRLESSSDLMGVGDAEPGVARLLGVEHRGSSDLFIGAEMDGLRTTTPTSPSESPDSALLLPVSLHE